MHTAITIQITRQVVMMLEKLGRIEPGFEK